MQEQYTFVVGPDYTIANFSRGQHFAVLDEWTDRTLEEFSNGMSRKSGKWSYRVESHVIPGRGKREEHTWTRNK